MNASHSEPLRQAQWDALLSGIHEKECTPFLGAGVSAPIVPVGAALSQALAGEYPFLDTSNLARVTQFMAIKSKDRMYPKRRVKQLLEAAIEQAEPGASAPGPHDSLASLDLPIYLTTNYDPLLVRAIEKRHPGKVTREVARWNREVEVKAGEFTAEPTSEAPLVFHLHGHTGIPASMVLTDDDYVEFVTAVARDLEKVVPPVVQEAMIWNSLLFVGYSLGDWNFHVLLRLIMHELADGRSDRLNVSVQLPPNETMIAPERRMEARDFIAEYLGSSDVQIHWGDAGAFLEELDQRFRSSAQ